MLNAMILLYGMKDDFLNDLNEEQKKAVLKTDGPMIIIAGAGSGKTRVLTYKVIYLIKEKKVDPQNILMLTFTNKAGNEMKERIQKLLKGTHLGFIGTFHAFCAKILRIEGESIGIPKSFVIYDDQDSIDAVKEAMKKLDVSIKDYKPSSVLNTISSAKNQQISESEYPRFARGHFQETVAKIYFIYQKILKENYALDFDDLLLKTVNLFINHPKTLEKYQNRFRYILVDEYQDTNGVQYNLTKMLSKKIGNICVVGDFSQSIYSWRGADFQNLIKFKNDFKGVLTFSLSQNYRSTQKILDAATSVIKNNTTHPVLSLWTEKKEGDDVVIFEAKNEHNEAEYILNEISNAKYRMPNIKLSDFAVLYRTNAQSRVLEEVFIHQGLPYILVGGTRFYGRKEVKDVLSYLRLLTNPKDMVSYKRIEKLGKGRLQKFLDYSSEAKSRSAEQKTIEVLDQVLKATEYLSFYNEKDEEDRQRLENIKELRSVAIEFPNMENFLENVALVEQEHSASSGSAGLHGASMPDRQISGQKPNAITLMTLHASKGLEFPIVFMVGMEEGLFPHSRSLMDKSELEEERRLCYVGMTRAKEKLFLSYSKKRLFFGQRTSNMISRFIMELPKDVLSKNLYLLKKDPDIPEYL